MFITTCPYCRTKFYISTKQFSLANGQVRCGRCGNTFDSRNPERLSENPSQESLDFQDNPTKFVEPTKLTITKETRGGYHMIPPHYLGCKIELNTEAIKPLSQEQVQTLEQKILNTTGKFQQSKQLANTLLDKILSSQQKTSSSFWLKASILALIVLLIQIIYFATSLHLKL